MGLEMMDEGEEWSACPLSFEHRHSMDSIISCELT